tara:strand:+ start:1364 stop:1597 length:234 start_codon:yes stop_codon:yes gene_type:complete
MTQEHDLAEIKSFLAKRGESDLLNIIRHIEEEFEKSIDPDYSSEEEESDSESDCSMDDIVPEEIEVKKTCEGHCTIA